MTAAPSDPNSSQAALENELRQAVLDGDMTRVEMQAFSAPLSDDFRFELIGGIIAAADAAPLVKRLLDDAGDDVTPTAYVNYLAKAAEQGHPATTILMLEKCTAAGIAESEGLARIAKNAPEDKIAALAAALQQEYPDKVIVPNMMLMAATEKKYGAVDALLDIPLPAGQNQHGSIMIMMLMNARDEEFADRKQDYIAMMSRLIDLCAENEEKSLSMLMMLVAYKLPEGKEYPELLEKFIDAGADPFALKGEAKRFLTAKFTELDDTARADTWRQRFDTWQQAYTEKHRHIFDTLFGQDFRAQDLLQTATEKGDTGLQLATKARRLPDVMRALTRGGQIAMDDIFAETRHSDSVIHMAIDREDAAVLLAPDYWAKKNTDILSSLESRLSDERKKWIDMDAIAAQVEHFRLQNVADDVGAQFRLRPRFG